MNIYIYLLIGALLISSCSSMTWKRPLKEKQATKATYEQCIEDNPNDKEKCEPYKDAYHDSVRQMEGKSEDRGSEGGLYDK